jgi:hypothetical protein
MIIWVRMEYHTLHSFIAHFEDSARTDTHTRPSHVLEEAQ